MVCGCVLQRGEGWFVSLTLCRYDIRMGLLLVRSCATCFSGKGEILGAC